MDGAFYTSSSSLSELRIHIRVRGIFAFPSQYSHATTAKVFCLKARAEEMRRERERLYRRPIHLLIATAHAHSFSLACSRETRDVNHYHMRLGFMKGAWFLFFTARGFVIEFVLEQGVAFWNLSKFLGLFVDSFEMYNSTSGFDIFLVNELLLLRYFSWKMKMQRESIFL